MGFPQVSCGSSREWIIHECFYHKSALLIKIEWQNLQEIADLGSVRRALWILLDPMYLVCICYFKWSWLQSIHIFWGDSGMKHAKFLFLLERLHHRLFLPFAIMGTVSFPIHHHVAALKPLQQLLAWKTTLLSFSMSVWWWVTGSVQLPKASLFCSGHQWSAVHRWQTAAVVSQTMLPGHLTWTASKKWQLRWKLCCL